MYRSLLLRKNSSRLGIQGRFDYRKPSQQCVKKITVVPPKPTLRATLDISQIMESQVDKKIGNEMDTTYYPIEGFVYS